MTARTKHIGSKDIGLNLDPINSSVVRAQANPTAYRYRTPDAYR